MDLSEPVDVGPEPISIQRCRQVLGEEADALSDDDVRSLARHIIRALMKGAFGR